MSKRHLFSLLTLVLALSLAACTGGNDDDPAPSNPSSEGETIFDLRPENLIRNTGRWSLVTESIETRRSETEINLTADYQHAEQPVLGRLAVTLYRDASAATSQAEEQRATWEGNAANSLIPVANFGDVAYTLNLNEAGLLRARDGVVWVSFEGEGTATNAELLALMQVGLDILRHREEGYQRPNVGGLGAATMPVDPILLTPGIPLQPDDQP